jgi:hypothetical protein
MNTIMETFGTVRTVEKIALEHGQSVELAMHVADYFIHRRMVPFYIRSTGPISRYQAMVADLQQYFTEFDKAYRGENYKPNGAPIKTPEGFIP